MRTRTRSEIFQEITELSAEASQHAKTCRKCYVPIFDDEGNPQYESEACPAGAVIIRKIRELETEYFKEEKTQ